MSSLICNATQCVFTRLDTDAPAWTNLTWESNDDFTNATEKWWEEDDTLAPWSDPQNQDVLSETVALTRDYNGNLFNARVEYDNHEYSYYSPSLTEWAVLPEGQTFAESRCSLYFCSFNDCFAYYHPPSMIGRRGVVHLVAEDVYYNIVFTNWTSDSYNAPCPGGYCKGEVQPPMPGMEGVPPPPGVETSPAVGGGVDFSSSRNHFGPNDRRQRRTLQTPKHRMTLETIAPSVNSMDSEFRPMPPYTIIPGLGGGGFSYVRDKDPILASDLTECPRCDVATASPSILLGPADGSFVPVSIQGVTPAASTKIVIQAVSQDMHPQCNLALKVNDTLIPHRVRPNARILDTDNDTSTTAAVELRRRLAPGQLNPFRYTIHFNATTASGGGACQGQVSVCVPPPGYTSCDVYLGYDATAKTYCEY